MGGRDRKKEKTQYEQALDLLRKAAFEKLMRGEKIALTEVFKDVLNAILGTFPKNCVSIIHPPHRDYTSNS